MTTGGRLSKLILLGGPTGVGKTTTLRLLEQKLPRSAVLDADDVWRVSTELAVEGTRRIALNNVIAVMRGYFSTGCEVGVVSWVFARSVLYEPVISGLEEIVDSTHLIYLVASPKVLKHRLEKRHSLHRLDYSLSRLRLIEDLPFPKLDTSAANPEEVVDRLITLIQSLGGSSPR